MSAFQRTIRHLRHISADGDVCKAAFDQFLDFGIQSFADPVEDNAPNLALFLKTQVAQKLRRNRSGHTAAIQNEDGRSFGRSGKTPRGSIPLGGDPVVVAHHPFDQGKILSLTVFLQQIAHRLFLCKKQIKVAGSNPQRLPMKHRVDIVRTALKGDAVKPSVFECLQNCAGNGRLSAPARRCGKHHSWYIL